MHSIVFFMIMTSKFIFVVIFAFATVFSLYLQILQNLQLYLCLNQLTAFPNLILYAIEYVEYIGII